MLIAAGVLLTVAWFVAVSYHWRCCTCYRPWAVWPVRGRLRRWVFVCHNDFKAHRRRQRLVVR